MKIIEIGLVEGPCVPRAVWNYKPAHDRIQCCLQRQRNKQWLASAYGLLEC